MTKAEQNQPENLNEDGNVAPNDPLAPEPETAEVAEDQAEPETIPVGDFVDPAEFEALKAENAALKDQALRAMAEAENARRRAQKDREDASKFAINSFARDLLPVADNLRRALDSVSQEIAGLDPKVQSLLDGVEATERELLRGLERHGVKKIEAIGKTFDPNLHEVMFEMPAGGQPAGTVMQVVENGYTLQGRILRPARVGVAADEGQGSAPSAGGSVDTQA
ncbi:MAG TPA: nucleotide exchange factor GrpE [Rhodospirillaceae bacterium]|nr:nucleotide exchange factor GrpE [Rhodospirillaceae bacterium]|tara:strand:- start:18985 stop:19653 length:669 start_codon:yes stop_codon:yes gene_type:complete